MPAPYSYVPNVPMPDVSQSLASLGKGISDAYAYAKAEREKQRQLEQQRAEMLRFELERRAVMNDPSGTNILGLVTHNPKLAEAVKMAAGIISDERGKEEVNALAPAFAAVEANDPESAKSIINQRVDALKSSNMTQEADSLSKIVPLIDKDPSAFKLALGIRLGAAHPEQFKSVFEALSAGSAGVEQSRAALEKAIAEARKAAIAADFEKRAQEMGLAKDQSQIDMWAQDNKIKAGNLALAQARFKWEQEQDPEKKDMARAEFDMKKAKFDQELRDQRAKMDNAIYGFGRAKSIIEKIVKTPLDTRKEAHGPIASTVLTVKPSVADYEELVKTLTAMNFKTAVEGTPMAGVAAAETQKLQDAVGSLSLRQSVGSMDDRLKEIRDLITNQERIAKERYGDISPSGLKAKKQASKQGAVNEPIYSVPFNLTP